MLKHLLSASFRVLNDFALEESGGIEKKVSNKAQSNRSKKFHADVPSAVVTLHQQYSISGIN